MKNAIAVFDIGKTNKKLFLFDAKYEIVYETVSTLPETQDEDGFACENVELLTKWILESFKAIQNNPAFHIKAINFSAYGASFVHLDKDGKVLTPLYNYLKPYSASLQKEFYDTYGGEETIAIETASPVLGNLNAGMQLYRLKYEKPEIHEQIKYSLHLPQYLSFLFSGQYFSDFTSIGCHTNLWDFQKNQYHDWVNKEEIHQQLAPINPIFGIVDCKKENIQIGTGLHDSSAALIPYLASFAEPFVLISTGTWSISLNPFNEIPLTFQELEQDCLCYLSHEGKPVKASRLFLGHEHEEMTKVLAETFEIDVDFYKQITIFDLEFTSAKTLTYQQSYCNFMQELVEKQIKSTNLILKNSPVKQIFVDGGFSKNQIYMHLLAQAYPEIEVYAAEIAQATALGAALKLHSVWNEHDLPTKLIDLKRF